MLAVGCCPLCCRIQFMYFLFLRDVETLASFRSDRVLCNLQTSIYCFRYSKGFLVDILSRLLSPSVASLSLCLSFRVYYAKAKGIFIILRVFFMTGVISDSICIGTYVMYLSMQCNIYVQEEGRNHPSVSSIVLRMIYTLYDCYMAALQLLHISILNKMPFTALRA